MSSNTPPPPVPFIVRFYGEGAKDFAGRTLRDILNYDNNTLERKHNYIQVLFPLPEGSPFNSEAPLLTKSTRDIFLQNPNLRNELFRAFARIASFYGFDILTGRSGDRTFVTKSNFADLATDTWLTRMDHNHLRITRIIRSLRILGLESLAVAFYDALVREDGGRVVSKNSLLFWERAAMRPLYLPPGEEDEGATGIVWLRDVVPE